MLWLGSGCQPAPAPGSGSSSAGNPTSVTTISPQDAKGWLESGLPPISEEIADAPVKLFNAQIQQNEFGQELVSVSYERPKVVRTMAAQLTLVLLPATGGRQELYVPNGLLIQPQSEGKIGGITDQLLNHRGRVSAGIRAYLEMRAATMNGTGQRPIRVSEVCWIGDAQQLSDATKRTDSGTATQNVPQVQLKPVPKGTLFSGTPLWVKCGDRWARGQVLADAEGEAVRLFIFLVRRDNPYLPWELSVLRSELRMEEAAVSEYTRDPKSFQDMADSLDSKLSRIGAPKKLQHVNPSELALNTPVLDFWNGMLDPCRVIGPTENGITPIKRVGLDNAEMSKPTKGLFFDPLASP